MFNPFLFDYLFIYLFLQVIGYAAFRLGILALHKSLRRDYAPTTRPDLAIWLIRTLSTVGLGLDAEQVSSFL